MDRQMVVMLWGQSSSVLRCMLYRISPPSLHMLQHRALLFQAQRHGDNSAHEETASEVGRSVFWYLQDQAVPY